MMAKNNQRVVAFGLWQTQTYDHHMLQNDSHSKLIQPLHESNIVEIQNPHYDNKACRQQYCIAKIGNGSFVDVNVKF